MSRRDWVRQPGVLFSGGVWNLPLTNLQDHRPQIVAEAASTARSATTFDVDLGFRRLIGVLHFQALRASSAGIMRVRAGLDPAFASSAYDSGWVSCWPKSGDSPSYNPWGEWSLSGLYPTEFYIALGMPRVFVPPSVVSAQYIRVEVADECADDPLQIGVFAACEVWEPPVNISYDWNVTPIDEADVQRVPFGSTYITPHGKRRRLNFGWKALPEADFHANQLDLTVVQGRSGPILVVPFPDDTSNSEKTAIYGLLSNENPIANPFFARWAQTMQVEQLI